LDAGARQRHVKAKKPVETRAIAPHVIYADLNHDGLRRRCVVVKTNTRIFLVSVSALVVVQCLVLFSARASRTTQQPAPPQKTKQDANQARQEFESRFPTADYDSPEPTNLEERAKRKNRNKHYDGKGLVQRNASSDGDISEISDAFLNVPALPVAQSGVVLTGTVLNSEAHLSNDKFAVYSEFTVQVETVLKGTVPTLSQTNLISVSRLGGKVRYPSGHQVLYSIAEQNMPALGTHYLFFLKTTDDPQTFEILRGYDITGDFIIPLDYTSGDASFRKTASTTFLTTVREAIASNH
jgi:hypothetical protein